LESRTNAYDPAKDRIVVRQDQAAIAHASAHYADVFSQGRSEYAIPRGALSDPEKLCEMSAFF
jgi:nitric oxide reductase subunit B